MKRLPRKKRMCLALILVSLFALGACAQKRPVLYPNAQLNAVGSQVAQSDIDACVQMARQHGAEENRGEKIAKDAVGSAVVGGVVGAVTGSFWGEAGRGAAAGAAGAGAGAATRGVIKSDDPDALFKRFVEKCLRDKGYEVVGWR